MSKKVFGDIREINNQGPVKLIYHTVTHMFYTLVGKDVMAQDNNQQSAEIHFSDTVRRTTCI